MPSKSKDSVLPHNFVMHEVYGVYPNIDSPFLPPGCESKAGVDIVGPGINAGLPTIPKDVAAELEQWINTAFSMGVLVGKDHHDG